MISNIEDLHNNSIKHPDASKASMRVLIGETEGRDDYAMRVITLDPNGYTPRHQHD
ncbi:MAG: hypothetical protein ACOC1L_07955 [Bacillota bacterium]